MWHCMSECGICCKYSNSFLEGYRFHNSHSSQGHPSCLWCNVKTYQKTRVGAPAAFFRSEKRVQLPSSLFALVTFGLIKEFRPGPTWLGRAINPSRTARAMVSRAQTAREKSPCPLRKCQEFLIPAKVQRKT